MDERVEPRVSDDRADDFGGAVVARAAVDGERWRREVGIADGDVDVGRKCGGCGEIEVTADVVEVECVADDACGGEWAWLRGSGSSGGQQGEGER